LVLFLIAHSVFCAISNFLTIRMVNILKNWMQFDHLEQDVSGNKFDFVLIVSQKGVEHRKKIRNCTENGMCNQKYTMHRHWHKTKHEDKHNKNTTQTI
jgi:hypothetical protein